MIEFFKRDPKYAYRHRLLEYLYEKIKYQPVENTELSLSKSDFRDIANHLRIEPETLKEYHYGLHSLEKDHVTCNTVNDVYEITITEAGIFAYTDKYWLREADREYNERINDLLKWLIPLIAVAISLAALLVSLDDGNAYG